MKSNALKAARPKASYDIAREIADMLFLDDGNDVSDQSYGTANVGCEAAMEAGGGVGLGVRQVEGWARDGTVAGGGLEEAVWAAEKSTGIAEGADMLAA